MAKVKTPDTVRLAVRVYDAISGMIPAPTARDDDLHMLLGG